MPSVFIVGHKDYDITSMFLKQGWEISTNSEEADLLQFTGGEDVTPALYGEGKHPTTDNNPDRDAFESDVYHYYIDKPKAGICRGGQFLNVMNGGKMWQHVNNHTRPHKATVFKSNQSFLVTSTHHQMMIPSMEGYIILEASESTIKMDALKSYNFEKPEMDCEAVVYPETKTFCYQPHPEWSEPNSDNTTFYFDQLERLIA